MERWQLQTAKNKFSEVIEKALHEGPQVVTRRGLETVVVLSMEEYRYLTRPRGSLVDFFKNAPFKDVEMDLVRNRDTGREVDL
ncbi:MAG: type II toxin-antitoxin system Phd/YefM family antitoxin [Desulfobacteraceae bacterium]|jgi:prevent-host-death family protein